MSGAAAPPSPPPPPDWAAVDLVVFDLDGTLYDQRALRARMLARLLAGLASGRLAPRELRALRDFRRHREALAEAEDADFEARQYALPAARAGLDPARVRAAVSEWMERRPLPLLARCAYPGAGALFAALRRAGKRVAVLSDHPAREKLAALGLDADPVVWAGDEGVGRLKPHPAGLLRVLRLAGGVPPGRALMVGDRPERDGEAARRAGVAALIRSRRPLPGVRTFAAYDDPVFRPVLGAA